MTISPRLIGRRSLRLNLSLSELASRLDDSSTLFASSAYKKDWPDIDNINPLKDPLLINKLEQALDADSMHLAIHCGCVALPSAKAFAYANFSNDAVFVSLRWMNFSTL